MEDKKPDSYVESASIMEYPTNIGAPVFSKNNTELWKAEVINNVVDTFDNRYADIKNQLEKLNEDIQINQILYNCKYNFQPKIGDKYHLYLNKDDESFLSLIAENEWGERLRPKKYLGTFYLDWNGVWNKVN